MIKSPGLIAVLSVGSVMQALSNVAELPSAANFPPQPAFAPAGARYIGFELRVLLFTSRIVLSAYITVMKSVGNPTRVWPKLAGSGVTAFGPSRDPAVIAGNVM